MRRSRKWPNSWQLLGGNGDQAEKTWKKASMGEDQEDTGNECPGIYMGFQSKTVSRQLNAETEGKILRRGIPPNRRCWLLWHLCTSSIMAHSKDCHGPCPDPPSGKCASWLYCSLYPGANPRWCICQTSLWIQGRRGGTKAKPRPVRIIASC